MQMKRRVAGDVVMEVGAVKYEVVLIHSVRRWEGLGCIYEVWKGNTTAYLQCLAVFFCSISHRF